jgi:hypothetical protein
LYTLLSGGLLDVIHCSRWFCICPGIIATALMPALPSGVLFAQPPEPGIREELVAEVGADVRDNEWELVASPDGTRLAWREKRGGQYVVLLNGKAVGGAYDGVGGIQLSKDAGRLAFAALKGKDRTIVVDGAEFGSYQKVYPVTFSPDSSRFAFEAKSKEGSLFVVDGKPGAAYKEVTAGAFSPDNRHFAFGAQKGKQWLVVADGAEGPAYDDVGRPRYSPEGGRLVYVARRGKAHLLVDNGAEKPLSAVKDSYTLTGFAPETEEPLFEVFDGANSRMLIGKVEGPMGHIRLRPVRCTAGCRHSVYATARIGRPGLGQERAFGQVVVDGKPGREYEGAPAESAGKAIFRAMGGSELRLQQGSFPFFNLDNHGVSTPSITGDFQHVAYAARRSSKYITVVVDGVEGPPMEAVPCDPQYSPDGKLYYVGVQSGKAILFIDGKSTVDLPLATPEWDRKGMCIGPGFADGGHYVFGIVQRDGTRFVADGSEFKLGAMLAIVGPHTQVADGRFHFAFMAMPQPEKPEALMIVDGKQSKVYNDIWPTTVNWSGSGVLTYVARQGQKLFRVTQTLP